MNGCVPMADAAWTALTRRGVSHLCDLDSFLPLRQSNSEWNNVTILGCILKETWVITRGNRAA